MPNFRTKRIVNHRADQMFKLVADVEMYPKFLPYCEALVVRNRRSRPDGREVIIADMTVGYKFVRETFTSQVTLDPNSRRIETSAIDGPFRSLSNRWWFEDFDDSGRSAVHFSIAWEFKSRMLGNLVGSLFDRAFKKYAEAFELRADSIHRLT